MRIWQQWSKLSGGEYGKFDGEFEDIEDQE